MSGVNVMLELDDIQSGVLRPRPTPYAATYVLLRIDDRKAGRELMRRASAVVASAAQTTSPAGDAWVSVALTFQGLKALGVPQDSLDSFAWEFRQGMAARAKELGDTGESSPEHWEKPLGTPDVHVVLTALAPDAQRLESALERARQAYERLPGIKAIWRQDCHALPTEKEAFGFRDGISHPAIEGSGIPGTNPREPPLKAGEFVLGYRDEIGGFPPMPRPEVLGRNGTYVVFPQAAPARGRVPPVPESECLPPRGGGTAGGQDDGALAERRAPGALPASRRSRAGSRPTAQQRLPLSG